MNIKSNYKYLLSDLSSLTRYKTKGPNLLEAYEDKMERRRKLVKLTNRGLKFYNDLKDKL